MDLFGYAPRQLGHGAVDTALAAAYGERTRAASLRNRLERSSTAFRQASRVGRNVAPNALALFTRPSLVAASADAQLSPLFAGTFWAEGRGSTAGVEGRRAMPDVGGAAARILELLDDAGGACSIGFTLVPGRESVTVSAVWPPAPSARNFGSWGAAGAGAGAVSASPTPLATARPATFAGVSRFAWREDMLRYRATEALRTKTTATLSSNRLALIHTTAARWCSSAFAGHRPAPASAAPDAAAAARSLLRLVGAGARGGAALADAGIALHPAARANVVLNP